MTPSTHTPAWDIAEQARIIAIGDIHADLDALLRILGGVGVIDDGGDWIGGPTNVVLMGDLNDRGPDSAATMAYVMGLADDARAQGGAVRALLGNHESLVAQGDFRYVRGTEAIAVEHFWYEGVAPEPDESTFWLTSDEGGGPLWCDHYRVSAEAGGSADDLQARLRVWLSALDCTRLVVGHKPTKQLDFKIAAPHHFDRGSSELSLTRELQANSNSRARQCPPGTRRRMASRQGLADCPQRDAGNAMFDRQLETAAIGAVSIVAAPGRP